MLRLFNESKKAISPVVAAALLLVVAVVSVISFQNWFTSFSSVIFSNVESDSQFSNSKIGVEGFIGDSLYFNAGDNTSVLSISLNSEDCSISGEYSGISEINISSCLENVDDSKVEVLIVTEDEIISSFQYLDDFVPSVSVSLNSCYEPSNVGSLGTEGDCNGMLIVDRTMLFNAVSSQGNQVDYYITYSGTNYTFGDSANNIFTGQVRDMTQLFLNQFNFNSDINYWETKNVVNMTEVFRIAGSFNQPLNNWNTSSVVRMNSMFFSAASFNQNINSWDVSSVETMEGMFSGANNFNQPLNNWNTSSVTGMIVMFYNSVAFNQDISSWCVSSIGSEPSNFRTLSALTVTNSPVWGTCP